MMPQHTYSSNAKLLLTGEYLVLRGAKALALPLLKTQTLELYTDEGSGHPFIAWQANAPSGRIWFKTLFELPTLDIISSTHPAGSAKLQIILLTLQQLRPDIFGTNQSFRVRTQLDFEPEWGLGTSSTLIANLAKWAQVDPFTLLQYSIGGSGYDIACASAKKPIFFQRGHVKPAIENAAFKPNFADQLYFVYLGQKKDSSQGIRDFNQRTEDLSLEEEVKIVSNISVEAAHTQDFNCFVELMEQHEALLSALLQLPTVKTQFPDFSGSLKSLGAWGGDFMLAMTSEKPEYVHQYFKEKGSEIVFNYNDLVRQ